MTTARGSPPLNRVPRRPVLGGLASAALLAACAPPSAAPPPAAPTAPPQANQPTPAAQGAPSFSHINPPAPGSAPKYGGTLRLNADDFWSSTQNIFTNWSSMYIYKFFFNQLYEYNLGGTQQLPSLATSWDVAPDAKSLTFHLRPGVKWHDGEPFTARDVEYTIMAVVNKDTASPLGSRFQFLNLVGGNDYREGKADSIAGIKVPDDLTIQLNYETPNATVLHWFASLNILPRHSISQIPFKDLQGSTFASEPIGTGPFKFSRREPNQFVEFARFDDYWEGKPYLDKVVHTIYRDASTAVLALENGEIDAMINPSGPDLQRARGLPNKVTVGGPVDIVNDLWYNFLKPYLQDKRIRQALLYAIDRASIIKSLYKDTAVITNTVFPNPRWTATTGLNAYAYDPDKAKQLLRDAGWDQSQSLELLYYYPDKLTNDALTAMQQYWAAVGVKVSPRLVDSPTLVKLTYQDGNFDFFYGGSAGGPEPDILSPYFLCDNVYPKGSNAGRYCNPELDKLLDAGRVTVSFDERWKTYGQVQKILNDDPVWEVLWQPVRYAVVDKKFANFAWHQFGGDTNFNSRPNTWYVQA